MHHYTRHFFLFLLFLSSFVDVRGQGTDQNYPVTASAFLVAQPNQRLSSYFSSSTALTVNLLLKDLTKSSIQVYLKWSMEGPGVRVASLDGYIPGSLITLDRGMIRRFSGLDLQQDYFRQDLIEEQGLNGSPLRTNLPEGFYTFRVQALEAGTGREVSNIGETYFSITTPLPPIINLPFNGAELIMTEPQRVNIQWMPRHYRQPGNITSYDLKVCKVPDGYEPTEALDACVNPVIDDKGNPGTFYPGNTGIGNSLIGALERGARYAARVTVHEFDRDGQEVAFANEGQSEVSWFRYGKPCVSPESFTIKETGPGRLQLNWSAQPDVEGYKVLYRKPADTQWASQTVSGTSASVTGLAAEVYEFTIQSIGTVGCPLSGHTQTFEVSDDNDALEDLPLALADPMQIPVQVSGCTAVTPGNLSDYYENYPGVPSTDSVRTAPRLKIPDCALQSSAFSVCSPDHPVIPLPTGGSVLTSLQAGDVLGIYDFAVFVTEASGSESFTGKGLVRLPFLEGTLALAAFSGVKAIRSGDGGCVYTATDFRLLNVSSAEVASSQRSVQTTLARKTDPVAYAGTLADALAGYEALPDTAAKKCSYQTAILQASEVLREALSEAGANQPDGQITALLEELRKITDTLKSGPKVDSLTYKYQTLISKLDTLKKAGGDNGPGSPTDQVYAIRQVQVSGIDNKSARISWELTGGAVSKYVVEYHDLDGGVLQETVTAPGLNLLRLREGMGYRYRILAYQGEQVVASYGEDTFQTLKRTLENPQNLKYFTKSNDLYGVKLTWDTNKEHRSYQLIYTDQNGVERTMYPTMNVAEISGLARDQNYTYRIMAYGEDGLVSEQVPGQFSLGTVCNIQIVASSLRIMPGTSLTLSTESCLNDDNGPGKVVWKDGTNIYRTSTIIVAPQVTTTYKLTCTLEKIQPNGERKPVECPKEVTVLVETACEEVTAAASPASIELGEPVMLSSTGCSGKVEWLNALDGGSVIGTNSNMLIYPKETRTYILRCSDQKGKQCLVSTDKVDVKCVLKLAVQYNFPNIDYHFAGGIEESPLQAALANFVFFTPFNILKWILLGNTKKDAAIQALGCPVPVTWDYHHANSDDDRSLDNFLVLKKIKNNTWAKATCVVGNTQCTSEVELEKPSKKCKDFQITIKDNPANSQEFVLLIDSNRDVTWEDGSRNKERVVSIPQRPMVYTVENTQGCKESIGINGISKKPLQKVPCPEFELIKSGDGKIAAGANTTNITFKATGCENGMEVSPILWKKKNTGGITEIVLEGTEQTQDLMFTNNDAGKSYTISATCQLTGVVKTALVNITATAAPSNPGIDPCNYFVYTDNNYNFFQTNSPVEFSVFGGNTISFLPYGSTPYPKYVRESTDGSKIYSMDSKFSPGVYTFEVHNRTKEGALCKSVILFFVDYNYPNNYQKGNYKPATTASSSIALKPSGNCGMYYQNGTNSGRFGIPTNAPGYILSTLQNNNHLSLGVFAIYKGTDYSYDPESIGLVDKSCNTAKGEFSFYEDNNRSIKIGSSVNSSVGEMHYVATSLYNKETTRYYGRCIFKDNTYCDTEITIVPGQRGSGRADETEAGQNTSATLPCQYAKKKATEMVLTNLLCEKLRMLGGNERVKLEVLRSVLSGQGIELAGITEEMVADLTAGKCDETVKALVANITGNESAATLNEKLVNEENLDKLFSNIVDAVKAVPVLTATSTAATCAANDGSITLEASGGTAPYQYSIDGTTFQEQPVFIELTVGTYQLTVKDSKNATATAAATITLVPDLVDVTASTYNPSPPTSTARTDQKSTFTVRWSATTTSYTFTPKSGVTLEFKAGGKVLVTTTNATDKGWEGEYRVYFENNHDVFAGFYQEKKFQSCHASAYSIDCQPLCREGFLPQELYDETFTSYILASSDHRKGMNNDNKGPHNDMMSCDMTDEQIITLNPGCLLELSAITNENGLIISWKGMASLMSMGKLQGNIMEMINKFSRSEGGEYSNSDLTHAGKNHKSTRRFVDNIKASLAFELRKNVDFVKNVGKLKYVIKNNYVSPREDIPSPTWDDYVTGLGIAVNDTWGYDVKITGFTLDKASRSYTARLAIEIFDHFGLDSNDIDPQIKLPYSFLTGFRSWFVLQHARKYCKKPFITIVDFEEIINGTY